MDGRPKVRSLLFRVIIAALILSYPAIDALAGSPASTYCSGYIHGRTQPYRWSAPYEFLGDQFVPLWLPGMIRRPWWVSEVYSELRAGKQQLYWNRVHGYISQAEYMRLNNDVGRISVSALSAAELYYGTTPRLQYITLRRHLGELRRRICAGSPYAQPRYR